MTRACRIIGRNDTRWIPNSARFVLLGTYARGTGALQVEISRMPLSAVAERDTAFRQIYQLAKGEVKMVQEIEKKDPFKAGSFGASSVEDR